METTYSVHSMPKKKKKKKKKIFAGDEVNSKL
jgi:hypothetical protein